MMRCNGDSASDHRGGTARASQESATSQRHRYHPDRPYRAAASCGIEDLRSPTPTPRQGSLHAHVSRTESRPMIAADTSRWVAFLEGGAGEDAQLLDKALEDRQETLTVSDTKALAHNSSSLRLASFQSAISELQVPAWSCLAAPSQWPDARRERVSFCCRVLPCDGVSLLLGQRSLSRTLHTHRKWTGFFQSGHA